MKSPRNNNTDTFLILLRAGLWEQGDRLLSFKESRIDFAEVYKIAQEQSVVGLLCAGMGKMGGLSRFRLTDDQMGLVMGELMAIEDRNVQMNKFIRDIVGKMNDGGILALIVKGQGIAQCYEKPLWRTCGDVDFFLDEGNYEKAKEYFSLIASHCEVEGVASKHFGCVVNDWTVELHGTLDSNLSLRIDNVLDEIQRDTFENKRFRVWNNGGVEVLLPCVDNDVLFVFTHILKHFYKGGIGLRQLCDWCRLMWTYREEIDVELLERRLRCMGLMSEWRAFGAFAVEYLGMPVDAMPLYDSREKWSRKASRILDFILSVGNFGHNRDMSYYIKYPYVVRKAVSFGRRVGDVVRHTRIFPLDSLRFLPRILFVGLRSAARGE